MFVPAIEVNGLRARVESCPAEDEGYGALGLFDAEGIGARPLVDVGVICLPVLAIAS
jgi:hypothetical protein